MIRLARADDVSAVAKIYEHIHDGEEAGKTSIGWIRGVYPTEGTALAAFSRGELYVADDGGTVTAAAIINRTQVDCYRLCDWRYAANDGEVLVLHTLVVEPALSRSGVGTGFVGFYEELAKKLGCTVLRMDTNEKNSAARALYKKLGYIESGIVPCVFNGIPDVMLVCLEKKSGSVSIVGATASPLIG